MDKAKGKRIQVLMPYAHALRDQPIGSVNSGPKVWASGSDQGRAGPCMLAQTPEGVGRLTDQHSVFALSRRADLTKCVTFLTVEALRDLVVPIPPGVSLISTR